MRRLHLSDTEAVHWLLLKVAYQKKSAAPASIRTRTMEWMTRRKAPVRRLTQQHSSFLYLDKQETCQETDNHDRIHHDLFSVPEKPKFKDPRPEIFTRQSSAPQTRRKKPSTLDPHAPQAERSKKAEDLPPAEDQQREQPAAGIQNLAEAWRGFRF